jgi:hypothetical protein
MVAISKEVATLEDAVAGAAPIAPLSSQELEILRMFAVGATAPRIAKRLASARRRFGIIFTTLTRNYGRIIDLRR